MNLNLLLLAASFLVCLIKAQDQSGYISLDCGLIPINSSYVELATKINYTSDVDYIRSGVSKSIKPEYKDGSPQQQWFLRSFPQGIRNCYTFNLKEGGYYFIRASFVYGNYDDLNQLPNFDIYIGPNLWTTVEIQDAGSYVGLEILHLLKSSNLQVCLVKTGLSTPFISTLELRPIDKDAYATQPGSLNLFGRYFFSRESDIKIRFPNDVHDRIWAPYFENEWAQINTLSTILTNNSYDPPMFVMNTAASPANDEMPLNLTIPAHTTFQFYIYMHFCELQELKANESRVFNVIINGEHLYGPFSPVYLITTTISIPTITNGKLEIILEKTASSTHPPLINAIEIYTAEELAQSETDRNDVDAITSIKEMYMVNKINWQGDPCLPRACLWEGLNCIYSDNIAPRITYLNLSSSRLLGGIAPSISKLTMLVTLDLSNNSLMGEVPEFLAQLEFLRLINLTSNKLSGFIPAGLLERKKKGLLKLSIGGNPGLCASAWCNARNKMKNKIVTPLIVCAASLVAVVIALLTHFILKKRKKRNAEAVQSSAGIDNAVILYESSLLGTMNRVYSFADVLKITNNFEILICKGRNGMVYLGYLGDTLVAVRMLSQLSAHESNVFKSEVELLLRVCHTSLVNVIGYCNEGDKLALVYEFMANGNLRDFLGKCPSNVVSWESKLRIAKDAAQGLEYLHNGCQPPIVHGNVKITNILLNENFDAKLGDFGLPRLLSIEGGPCVSSGYLDPEYSRLNSLTEKSDVYSFGVVLLELFTNQPATDETRTKFHIVEWVSFLLSKGELINLTDQELQGNSSANSFKRVIEVALRCVDSCSSTRPPMADVTTELKQCLAAEVARKYGRQEMER